MTTLQLVINKSLKTQEQFNIAEVIEICMMEKEAQFIKFLERTNHFTSDMGWTGNITEYEQGFYLDLCATQCTFKCFLDNTNNVIRKPNNIKLDKIRCYTVSGNNTEIQKIY